MKLQEPLKTAKDFRIPAKPSLNSALRKVRKVIKREDIPHEAQDELQAAIKNYTDAVRETLKKLEVLAQSLKESPRDFSAPESLEMAFRDRLLEEKSYTSKEVAECLGSASLSNPRQYAASLHRRGELLGVKVTNRYLYPAFQFDEDRRKVYDIVNEISKIMSATDDPWGVISWWISPNARLPDCAAPKELLPEPKNHETLRQLAISTTEDSG